MRVTKTFGILTATATLGATITIAAPTASAVTSMGSCALSGAGPAPSCSYQLTDDDIVVRFRSATSTTSTLICRADDIGSIRLRPGASGTVSADNLSSGFHRYDVGCSTVRGGRGGVSRSDTISVYVRSEPITPPGTDSTPPSFRQAPPRTSPTTSPPEPTTSPTTTTSTPPATTTSSPTTTTTTTVR
ncbi:hypothetical protein [Gordonia sp. CPCC 205333]|uniref:hypothetical protein n=1 Tax=Gordonia sp. CPCC 205333 TaxID=3140790 RepID=UPI003AF34ADB